MGSISPRMSGGGDTDFLKLDTSNDPLTEDLHLAAGKRYHMGTDYGIASSPANGGNDFLGLLNAQLRMLWNGGSAGSWSITNTPSSAAYSHVNNTAAQYLFAMGGAGVPFGLSCSANASAVQFGTVLGFVNRVYLTAGDGRKLSIPSNVDECPRVESYSPGEYQRAWDLSPTHADLVPREILLKYMNDIIDTINNHNDLLDGDSAKAIDPVT